MEEPNDFHEDVPSYCTLKWMVKNVSALLQKKRLTDKFRMGPHEWQLTAFRRGSNLDGYLSIYVFPVNCTSSRYIKLSIAIKKDEDFMLWWGGSGKIKYTRQFRFTEDKSYWGFDDFIQFKELMDPRNGYIVDDAFSIEVELCFSTIMIEELVPLELRESIEEIDPVPASTSVSPDNNSAFICAFGQTSKEPEDSGCMLHIANGEELEEDEISGPNVTHVHKKCQSGMKFSHSKTKKGKKLWKDNSSAVQRKQRGTDRGKQKKGEKSVESEREAIQDGEEVIESGEETIRQGAEKWQGTVRRCSKRLRAAAEREKGAENGEILDGNKVEENDKENKKILEEITSSENRTKRAKMTPKSKFSKPSKGGSVSGDTEDAPTVSRGETSINHASFVVTMSESSIGEKRREIPIKFAREYLRPKNTDFRLIVKSNDSLKSWEVVATYCHASAQDRWRLVRGWPAFREDMKLEVGDICSFQKVVGANEMKVSVIRRQSGGGKFNAPGASTSAVGGTSSAPVKKPRGRPKGSKIKPKQVPPTAS